MSKRNKVNPGQYTQAGRLSPDDAAREERKTASLPGISNRETAAEERDSAPEGTQSSSKSGSRSTAQKTAEAKYVDRPHPSAEKVDGAFGRETGEKQ